MNGAKSITGERKKKEYCDRNKNDRDLCVPIKRQKKRAWAAETCVDTLKRGSNAELFCSDFCVLNVII